MELLIPVVICVILAYFFIKFVSKKPKQKQDKTRFAKENTTEQPKLKMYSSSLSVEEAQNIVIDKIEKAIVDFTSPKYIAKEDINLILKSIAIDVYEIGMVYMQNRKLGEEYLQLNGYSDMQNDFFMTDFAFKIRTGQFAIINEVELDIYLNANVARIAKQTCNFDYIFKTGDVEAYLHFVTERLRFIINNKQFYSSIPTTMILQKVSFDVYSIAMIKLNNEILGKELLNKNNYIKLQKHKFQEDFKQKINDHYFDNINDTSIYDYLNEYTDEITTTTLLLEKITTTSDKRFEYYT